MNNLYFHLALLYEKLENKGVHCLLCSHFCKIKNDEYGTCELRKNIDGELFTITWGKPEGLALDPIEKKPLYHFKPGSKVLSFGTPGCNFTCKNCQNSHLSQQFHNSYAFISNPIFKLAILRLFVLENINDLNEQLSSGGNSHQRSAISFFAE